MLRLAYVSMIAESAVNAGICRGSPQVAGTDLLLTSRPEKQYYN